MVPDYPKGGEEVGRLDKGEGEREGEGVEEGRRLFAHYLWGGGLVVAEGIESATKILDRNDEGDEKNLIWNVKQEKVLEVGAGKLLLTC